MTLRLGLVVLGLLAGCGEFDSVCVNLRSDDSGGEAAIYADGGCPSACDPAPEPRPSPSS